MSVSLRNAALRSAALVISVLLAFGAVSLPARAQELSPEHIALARQYVDLSYRITTFEQSLVKAGIDVSDTILRQNPALEEKSNEAIGKAISYFADQKDDVMNQFARVYALQFTMDELKAMNEFYSTDVGKKLASLQSTIDQSIVKLYTIYEDNMRKEMFARVRADLIAQGAKL